MSMFNKVTKTFQWGQHSVTLETGEISRQAWGQDKRHATGRFHRCAQVELPDSPREGGATETVAFRDNVHRAAG